MKTLRHAPVLGEPLELLHGLPPRAARAPTRGSAILSEPARASSTRAPFGGKRVRCTWTAPSTSCACPTPSTSRRCSSWRSPRAASAPSRRRSRSGARCGRCRSTPVKPPARLEAAEVSADATQFAVDPVRFETATRGVVLLVSSAGEGRAELTSVLSRHADLGGLVAPSFSVGLCLAERHRPELVLLDLGIANVHAFDACRALAGLTSRAGRRCRVVAGTTTLTDAVEKPALMAGAASGATSTIRRRTICTCTRQGAGRELPGRARARGAHAAAAPRRAGRRPTRRRRRSGCGRALRRQGAACCFLCSSRGTPACYALARGARPARRRALRPGTSPKAYPYGVIFVGHGFAAAAAFGGYMLLAPADGARGAAGAVRSRPAGRGSAVRPVRDVRIPGRDRRRGARGVRCSALPIAGRGLLPRRAVPPAFAALALSHRAVRAAVAVPVRQRSRTRRSCARITRRGSTGSRCRSSRHRRASLSAPDYGLFVFSPVLALGALAALALVRRGRGATASSFSAIATLMFLFLGRYT